MRGEFIIPIRVPKQGLLANIPPQDLPPESLSAGLNTFIDIDGVLKPRLGYASIAGYLSDTNAIVGLYDAIPIIGGVFQDHRLFIQTTAHTYLYTIKVSSGQVPTVSSQVLLATYNAALDNQAVFAALLEQQGTIVYWLSSNSGALQRVDLNTNTVTTVSGAPATASDITMLGNRIVMVNPGGDFAHPFRVQWSTRFNGQVWNPFGFIDLDSDTQDTIKAIRLVDRQSALIFRQRSIWLLQTAATTNEFNPFIATKLPIQETVSGPVREHAICQSGTTFYYLGNDFRVYQLRGTQVTHISAQIDATIRAKINAAFASRTQAVYMPQQRLVWFFIPTDGSATPNSAIIYNELDQHWEPLATFNESMTAALNPSDLLYSPTNTNTGLVSNLVYTGTALGNLHNFFQSGQLTDNGTAIPWNVTWPIFSTPDPNGMILVDGVELYFVPGATQTLTLNINGLTSPESATTNQIINAATVDVSNEGTWNVAASVGLTNPAPLYPASGANIKSNFLQFKLSATGAQGPVQFIGARIFCNQDKRPDFRAI